MSNLNSTPSSMYMGYSHHNLQSPSAYEFAPQHSWISSPEQQTWIEQNVYAVSHHEYTPARHPYQTQGAMHYPGYGTATSSSNHAYNVHNGVLEPGRQDGLGNHKPGPPNLAAASGGVQHAPAYYVPPLAAPAPSIQAPLGYAMHNTNPQLTARPSNTFDASTAQPAFTISNINITLSITVSVSSSGSDGPGVAVSEIPLSEEDDKHLKSYILNYVAEKARYG